MKQYIINFLESNRHRPGDFIPCAVCGSEAVDIHHIKARGMGGSKHRDNPENLIALCRNHHDVYGDLKIHRPFLEEAARRYRERRTADV